MYMRIYNWCLPNAICILHIVFMSFFHYFDIEYEEMVHNMNEKHLLLNLADIRH